MQIGRPAPSRVIMRAPSHALRRALSEHPDRQSIDPDLAAVQHRSYVAALRQAGVSVIELPPDDRLPDACFTWDTVLAFAQPDSPGATALLVRARPGSPSRRPEVESVLACAQQLAGKAVQTVAIEEPGTLDGGDVLTYGDRVAIGISARTNEAGARQLARAVERLGYRAFLCPMDRYLHLASAVSPLGAGRLIGTPVGFAALDASGADAAPAGEVERIVIAEEDVVAANVLAIAGRCFLAAGHPRAAGALRAAGETAVEIELGEFVLADGGPTCLVAPVP